MENGFVKGQSDNLPKLDSMMLAMFYKNNTDFTSVEIRGVKAQRSERESYGDNAIGYVQVKRDGDICTVRAKMTPEHKLNTKAYTMCALVDEKQGTVVSVSCEGCVAGLGGCKHAVAFLAWLHRRSEDAPVTSVKCYWKKSSLSSVKSAKSFKIVDEIGAKKARVLPPKNASLKEEFLQICVEKSISKTQMTSYCFPLSDLEKLSIHHLHIEFLNNGVVRADPEAFNTFAKAKITPDLCKQVEKLTRLQSEEQTWHELRFGRVTASKLYAAAHCNTLDGSLVEQILGAKVRATEAMKRGTRLEADIRNALQKKLNCTIRKCGFFLHKNFPVFGASPDGIGNDFVVEIKCPASTNTSKQYFTATGDAPSPKHYAQIQLQMYFADKAKACFCVADPNFEDTKVIDVVWVEFNKDYCDDALSKAFAFWMKAVYPKLAS